MAIYTNGPVVGPDGSFVDMGSRIPDSWVTEFGDWVANRIERGDFVEQDEPPAQGFGTTSATPMDAAVHLNSERKTEATQ